MAVMPTDDSWPPFDDFPHLREAIRLVESYSVWLDQKGDPVAGGGSQKIVIDVYEYRTGLKSVLGAEKFVAQARKPNGEFLTVTNPDVSVRDALHELARQLRAFTDPEAFEKATPSSLLS